MSLRHAKRLAQLGLACVLFLDVRMQRVGLVWRHAHAQLRQRASVHRDHQGRVGALAEQPLRGGPPDRQVLLGAQLEEVSR